MSNKDIEFLAELATWICKINWTIDMTESISLWHEIAAEMGVEKKLNFPDYYGTDFMLKFSFDEIREKIEQWLKN